MRIATILPVRFQYLEVDNDYHMALAHLTTNSNYAAFFLQQASQGNHVIMDNGVVEGEQQGLTELISAVARVRATEVILPDRIGDVVATLRIGQDAIDAGFGDHGFSLMAVPQGSNTAEWRHCLKEMLDWPVRTIGISKFVVQFCDRITLLRLYLERIRAAGKEIHLLG